MGLILLRGIQHSDIELSGREDYDISKIFITIPKSFLSHSYEAIHYSSIEADVLDVYTQEGWFSHSQESENYLQQIQEEQLTLVFVSMKMGVDRLYFDNESWFKYRDFGLLPEQSKIEIRITSVETDEGLTDVFPKMDVKV